jgi:hypothetical protein
MESMLRTTDSAGAISSGTGYVALRRQDGKTVVRTALTLQSEGAALEVRLALEVDRDGQPFFRRTWEERIALELLLAGVRPGCHVSQSKPQRG